MGISISFVICAAAGELARQLANVRGMAAGAQAQGLVWSAW